MLTLKQKLAFNKTLFAKIKNARLFHKIKTWRQFLLMLEMDECEIYYPASQLDSIVSPKEIEAYEKCVELRTAFEDKYKLTYKLEAPFSLISFELVVEEQDASKDPLPRILRPASTYGFWFQNKATRGLLDGILRNGFRCQLVEAGTGTGKTFIAGSLIEQLWNPALNFFKNCYSPWPVLYITRASIVEQTQRVMENVFGLDPVKQCTVINVEQLRSKYGKMMVEEKTVVVRGNSEIHWFWREIIHPRIFIIDESHLAKNEDSTQSKIVQSLADVKGEIYIILMSATPFLRISDAKYFCINTHKQLGK